MNHIWKVYELNRTVADGVINKVTYACESELSGSSTRLVGFLDISGSASDPDFVAFENLTEGDVLAWVTSSIDYTDFETRNSASLADTIYELTNPTESTGNPWDN